MTSFAYRAVHASGRVQKGRMEAANENELAFYLRQLDLELIEAKGAAPSSPFAAWRGKSSAKERLALCRQMEDLLRAGLPLAEALDFVVEAAPQGAFQGKLVALAQAVRAGQSISQAFALYPRDFDPVFLAILAAAEQSGDLSGAFARLHAGLRWQEKLRRELTRALRYPLFLLAVALGVTSFMMAVVVPQIVDFLAGIGKELPLMTRLLIGSARLFAALWWTLPLAALGGGVALALGRHASSSFAQRSDGWLLRIPFLGDALRKLALARFASSLTLLLNSNLSLSKALPVAGGTLGNRFLQAQAQDASAALLSGKALSEATASLFPPLAQQMIKVGERSGAMPRALEEIARAFDQDVHDSVESLLGAMEPALTLLIGGLLAWIVLAVLGPVYGSLGALSRGM